MVSQLVELAPTVKVFLWVGVVALASLVVKAMGWVSDAPDPDRSPRRLGRLLRRAWQMPVAARLLVWVCVDVFGSELPAHRPWWGLLHDWSRLLWDHTVLLVIDSQTMVSVCGSWWTDFVGFAATPPPIVLVAFSVWVHFLFAVQCFTTCMVLEATLRFTAQVLKACVRLCVGGASWVLVWSRVERHVTPLVSQAPQVRGGCYVNVTNDAGHLVPAVQAIIDGKVVHVVLPPNALPPVVPASDKRGYKEEAALSGSPIEEHEYPKCVVRLCCKAGNGIAQVGLGFRLGDNLVTASHVMHGPKFVTHLAVGKKAYPVDFSQKKAVAAGSAADLIMFNILPAIWANLGVRQGALGSAKMSREASVPTPLVDGKPGVGRGRIVRGEGLMFGHYASTNPGSSGAPVMQGDRIVGMHLGAAEGVNRAVDILPLISSVMLLDAAGELFSDVEWVSMRPTIEDDFSPESDYGDADELHRKVEWDVMEERAEKEKKRYNLRVGKHEVEIEADGAVFGQVESAVARSERLKDEEFDEHMGQVTKPNPWSGMLGPKGRALLTQVPDVYLESGEIQLPEIPPMVSTVGGGEGASAGRPVLAPPTPPVDFPPGRQEASVRSHNASSPPPVLKPSGALAALIKSQGGTTANSSTAVPSASGGGPLTKSQKRRLSAVRKAMNQLSAPTPCPPETPAPNSVP